MGRFGLFQAGYSRCIVGSTIEVKSAPSSPSRSPTPCRLKHSHLASRVSQGERRVSERVSASQVACTLTLDRWAQMDSLLLSSRLRNRFVLPLWIRQTDT